MLMWLTLYRTRKVKCDEAKPNCQRCVNTGRKCDGYSSDILSSNRNLEVIQRLSTNIPGSSEEKRGFHFFVRNTATELSGYYDSSFWARLILAASTQEPSLRHAVIAIGALHEDFSQKQLLGSACSARPTLTPNEYGTDFALSQYSKAIAALRRSLSNGKQEPLTALMSCLLFVCFDSLRGWFESAMVHLQSGIRILRDIRKTSKDSNVVEDDIAPLFVRLSLQSIIYVDTRSTTDRKAFARELMDMSAGENVISEQFENLDQARGSLEQAAEGLFRMFYMCESDLPRGLQNAETFENMDKYSAQLHTWNLTFEKFMLAKSPHFTNKEVRGAALLKIHHTTAKIMAGVRPKCDDLRAVAECVNAVEKFMEFIDDFQIVVTLSRSLIAAAEQDAKNGKPPLTFSTDLGIVGPLYYTCVKCPIHNIRTAAMDLLLRCPRREGMWNSIMVAKMIEEYWEIEQRHKAAQDTGEEVDEFGFPIPFNEAVDLIFTDGMRWEWKWKVRPALELFRKLIDEKQDHSMRRSRSSSPGLFSWTDVLQEQSLFGDAYSALDSTLPRLS